MLSPLQHTDNAPCEWALKKYIHENNILILFLLVDQHLHCESPKDFYMAIKSQEYYFLQGGKRMSTSHFSKRNIKTSLFTLQYGKKDKGGEQRYHTKISHGHAQTWTRLDSNPFLNTKKTFPATDEVAKIIYFSAVLHWAKIDHLINFCWKSQLENLQPNSRSIQLDATAAQSITHAAVRI